MTHDLMDRRGTTGHIVDRPRQSPTNGSAPPSPKTFSADVSRILDHNLRILIIDDDPIQTAFAAEFLTTSKIEVVPVSSAKEGLRKLVLSKFDFVLVDYDMPEMTGLEFIKIVRSNPNWSSMPIMMVSSRTDVGSVDDAYKAGADYFDHKPVSWPLLANQIGVVLRKRETGRATRAG